MPKEPKLSVAEIGAVLPAAHVSGTAATVWPIFSAPPQVHPKQAKDTVEISQAGHDLANQASDDVLSVYRWRVHR